MKKLIAKCECAAVTLAVYKHVRNAPPTHRCVYCCGRRFFNFRPKWTYGIRPRTLLGRVVLFLWPPHIDGPNYGGEFTDGMCDDALRYLFGELNGR